MSKAPAIDKSALAISEPERIRDRPYREHVATLPCLACNRYGVQAAHESHGNYARGLKASDDLCMPLCPECHRKHDQGVGISTFWIGVLSANRLLMMDMVKAWLRQQYREWKDGMADN